MILLAALMLAQTADSAPCQMMAVPMSPEVVKQRLNMRNPPAYPWVGYITCPVGKEITAQQIMMAIASECRTRRLPIPLFLPKAAIEATLFRNRGGKAQLLKRVAMYAGSGVAIASGQAWAASLGPLADIATKAAEARIPDIADLAMEIPAQIKFGPMGAATVMFWSSKMRQYPEVIGPFEFGGENEQKTTRQRQVVFRQIANQSETPAIKRDSRGRIARSGKPKTAFAKANPCPATGLPKLPCKGYVIDHIRPLACGGADAPDNMQWQTKRDGKAKDRWELGMDGCPAKIRTKARIARWMRATVGQDR